MIETDDLSASYQHFKSTPDPTHEYLWPVINEIITKLEMPNRTGVDVGCGTGATTDFIRRRGIKAVGLEPSPKGVEMARQAYPECRIEVANAYDPLHEKFGRFDLVTSFEVIEHLYNPQAFIRSLFELTNPGGRLVLSTPYHGYWKNLTMAILGKWDDHLSPLYLGGHIKFFSENQLATLLIQEGFHIEKVFRVGRALPSLAKSMVVLAYRDK